jgi:hypothetical protein
MTNGFGVIKQLEPFGPEQVKLIESLNPFSGATERVYCAVPFSVMDTPVDCGVTVKGAVLVMELVPVPVRVTCCGEFDALPVTVSVADSKTRVVGLKVRVTLQLAPIARVKGVAEQLFVAMTKSVLPEIAMLVMVSTEVVELLVTVTVCAGLLLFCS